MPIDASIYQGVQTPQQQQEMMYRNQLSQLQIQQAMRQAQAQNMLARLFTQPQQMPQGQPPSPGMQPQGTAGMQMNPQVLQQIMAADPNLGMRLQQMMAERQMRQVQMQHYLDEGRAMDQKLQQGQFQEFNQQLLPIKQVALSAYAKTLQQTGDPRAAIKAGQDAYVQGLQQLPKGMFGPDLLRQAQSWTFNPDLARAQVFGSKYVPPRPFMQITGPNTERQVTVDPVTGQAVPASPDVPRFRPVQERRSSSGKGNPAEMTKGWQFFQDPDTHTLYRMNPNAGLAEKMTNQGWVPDKNVDPTSLKRMGGQGQGFGSSLNQRFVNRVAGAANEGAAALISIAGMKKPNSGLFSMASVAGAGGKNPIKGFLTPGSIKRYNATIAGLAPEIAAAQNQGMAPHDQQIQAIEQAITIGPTDDLKTQRYRVALAARYLRKALEVSQTIGTADQKKQIDGIIKQLSAFPDPDAVDDDSWEQGMFGKGKRTPPTQAVAKPKGIVTPQLLQQYAGQHGLTPQQAAAYLQEQGYAIGQ